MEQIRQTFGWTAFINHEEQSELILNQQVYGELTRGRIFAPNVRQIKWCRDPRFWYMEKMITHDRWTLWRIREDQSTAHDHSPRILLRVRQRLRTRHVHALEEKWPDGPIQCGGVITILLDALHHSEMYPTHKILMMNFLDSDWIGSMKGCTRMGPERALY